MTRLEILYHFIQFKQHVTVFFSNKSPKLPYSALHCSLHTESMRTMFGFVCSSQIVTYQDQIWVHWEFWIFQTQLSWCLRYWIRCTHRLSFGMMSNISEHRRFQALLDVVSGQCLASGGGHSTTHTNMISKLRCADSNAKHCKLRKNYWQGQWKLGVMHDIQIEWNGTVLPWCQVNIGSLTNLSKSMPMWSSALCCLTCTSIICGCIFFLGSAFVFLALHFFPSDVYFSIKLL